MSLLGWEVIGVTDTEGGRAEWTFPAEPGAVRDARAAVRGRLRDWGLESLADLTALLVSELVTNALRHATGPIGVRLVRPAAPGDVLRVEVSDPFPDLPGSAPPGPRTRAAAVSSWSPTRPGVGVPGPEARARPCGSSSRCQDETAVYGGPGAVRTLSHCRANGSGQWRLSTGGIR